ncbi:aspartic peptidase domain-containing protein [Mycena galericulata]|nr:aspartic peptidase domain-containing protein [Mycena galericulata]
MLRFPAALLSLLFLHLELRPVYAKPGRQPQYTVDADNNIINNYNDRYTLNLTVAGTVVNVMLDTGSTDMWVAPSGGVSDPVNNTGAFATIYYGDGSNFVNGSVDLGLVEIAGFDIPNQAFINVINSVGEESDEADSIFGLVGLGFDGPGGSIPSSLTAAGYNGTDVGKAVLSSIYDQNPASGRFFAFSLSRVGDVGDSADASLVISGYDDKYAVVQNAPPNFQYPVDSGRWSVLTSGVSVNGAPIPWTAYNGTADGQKAVLFDTGTTNFLVPKQVRDAIYSAVPGAVLAPNSSIPNTKFSEDNDVWVVPCKTAVNFTTTFAEQDFPIHPLDVTDTSVLLGPDGNNYTVCVGSITNGGSILGPGLDALYGDSFLRNVYSVFSFGNESLPPFVQLLSDTNTEQAAADFASVRAEILQGSPTELSPQAIINLFDGPSSVSSASPSSVPTAPYSSAAASVATSTLASSSDALDGSGKPAVDLTDSSSSSGDSAVEKYGPIIVGLLAANLVILLLVAFLGIMSFVRGGRTAGPTRAVNPSYVPVKLREDVPRSSFSERYAD